MPDQFAKPAPQLGAQIPNTASPTAGKGLALDETGRVDPGLLQQAVATNGQVLAWSTTQNKWVPTSLSGGSTPTPALPSKFYDFTIAGADQASIDTNVDGPGAGLMSVSFDLLEVWIIARTDAVAATSSVHVTVNNDTGSNYDLEGLTGNNTTVSAGTGLAGTGWDLDAHGSGGSTGYAASVRITMPGYSGTTFWKGGEATAGAPDATAGNDIVRIQAVGWRSTAAINRLKVAAPGASKLKIGSRLLIYGR